MKKKDNEKLWGTGKAKREFLHVDDAADAFLFLLENWESESHINVGSGKDITIKELAQKIAFYAGYKGEISWNNSTDEDGMPQKLLDVSKLNELNFQPKITLNEGIKEMILIYKNLKNKT